MKAYVFPGQGAQFPGMGKDLYEKSPLANRRRLKADQSNSTGNLPAFGIAG